MAARHWLCPGVLPEVYEPRSPAGTVLHRVVRTHLDRFLAETAAASDGAGVPRFIEREFRDFLRVRLRRRALGPPPGARAGLK